MLDTFFAVVHIVNIVVVVEIPIKLILFWSKFYLLSRFCSPIMSASIISLQRTENQLI